MARHFSAGRRRMLHAVAMLPAALTAEAAAPGRYLTPSEFELVNALAETIIPADAHSGGAKAAGVADFVEQTLHDTVDSAEKALWRKGLRLVEGLSKKECGKAFVNASPEERVRVIEALSAKAGQEARFFQEVKRLTVLGYYTSRIGIDQEMEYKGNRIHQDFAGCDGE